MHQNQLFTVALGLTQQWKVTNSQFDSEEGVLQLKLDFPKGTRFGCPECGQLCPAYDTESKRWRHLNFFQHRCWLEARVPRVSCPEHGVRQVEVPWARPGSGFTLFFEAWVMLLAKEMPMLAVARLVGEQDTRLWRVLLHYVNQAHGEQDWSQLEVLGVDETSAKRGHRYVTLVTDAKERKLLFMEEGRGSETVAAFAQEMPRHQADPEQIESVALDMSAAYTKGVQEQFPQAHLVYDRFHVMQLAGQAVDAVRKQLQWHGAELKASLWDLRGNEWNLSHERLARRYSLAQLYQPLGRALALRGALQDLYALEDRVIGEQSLKWWCQWAWKSKLAPFVKLSRTIREHWNGVVSFFDNQLTSAAMEAINGLVQLAKRRARGYRTFEYFRAMAYWTAGKLNLNLPKVLPT